MIRKIIGSVVTLIGSLLFINSLIHLGGTRFNIGYLIGYLTPSGLILFLGIFILTRKAKRNK